MLSTVSAVLGVICLYTGFGVALVYAHVLADQPRRTQGTARG